jgi:acetoin utilization protein AcuC
VTTRRPVRSGRDSRRLDPLASLELNIDAQRAAHAAILALAHDLAGGLAAHRRRGYELAGVVPRTWTHLIAEAAGQPIDPATPAPLPWREYPAQRTSLAASEQMTASRWGRAASVAPTGAHPSSPAATWDVQPWRPR